MKLEIHHFEEVDSTNSVAEHYAKEGAAEGTVIIADTQTKGRGRQGSSWVSDKGNIYTSVILRPLDHKETPSLAPREKQHFGQLAFVSALGVLKGLEAVQPIPSLKLKWPNDGLVDGKKLFGILVEVADDDAVIVGVGINLNVSPSLENQQTTSLKELWSKDTPLEDVFHSLLKSFWAVYQDWLQNGFESIKKDWLERALWHNEVITKENITGVFTDLGDDGALMLKDESGTFHRVVKL
jgi:BirA family biotin operon repressor/biotin-[acetyl-CoA-carboxylase] ligase